MWGCLYAGIVAVPVCPPDPTRLAHTLPHFNKIVEDCGAVALLTDRQYWLVRGGGRHGSTLVCSVIRAELAGGLRGELCRCNHGLLSGPCGTMCIAGRPAVQAPVCCLLVKGHCLWLLESLSWGIVVNLVRRCQVKRFTQVTGMFKALLAKQPQWPALPWHVTDDAAVIPPELASLPADEAR